MVARRVGVAGHPRRGELLTQEAVRRLFSYDPETGRLTWKTTYSRFIGKDAGTIDAGRIRLTIAKKTYEASRIIWLYVYGELPAACVDHIDRNPLNNSIANLRQATKGQNAYNRPVYNTTASGLKGAYFHKPTKRWSSVITANKKRVHLGYFKSAEEAHAAYTAAAVKLHGEFACIGGSQPAQ